MSSEAGRRGNDARIRAGLLLLVFAGSTGCNAIFGLEKGELGDPFGTDASAGGAGGTAGQSNDGSTAGAGGISGASGAAGAGGGSGCGTCGALEKCFSNQLCVAKLVSITGGYSIDATEVTMKQYAAWRGTGPQAPPVTSSNECQWKTSYRAESGTGDYPVVNVDWCDAYGYCKGVGKRLCGMVGGGPAEFDSGYLGQQDQWFRACTSGGANAYPYGNTYQPEWCNGSGYSGAAVPVGSLIKCESAASGYTDVFDLSGNVFEWEDSCSGVAGASDNCHVRGGAFSYGSAALACNYPTDSPRNQANDSTGFRCCSDP